MGIPTAAHEPDAVEDRGLLGAAGGAAAAWGGMKVTGANSKMGFLGKAGLVVGAAVAGSILEDLSRRARKIRRARKTRSRSHDSSTWEGLASQKKIRTAT